MLSNVILLRNNVIGMWELVNQRKCNSSTTLSSPKAILKRTLSCCGLPVAPVALPGQGLSLK